MATPEEINRRFNDTFEGLARSLEAHKETPLDVKIQCAGLLIKQETPQAQEQQYVAHMPPQLPGEDSRDQLAVWLALYSEAENDDPEWQAAVGRILELAATRQRPQTLSA